MCRKSTGNSDSHLETSNLTSIIFIVLSIIRFIFLAAGLGLSAVMLYLTNDGADKFRLFYSIISIIPIGLCICLYTLRGKNE